MRHFYLAASAIALAGCSWSGPHSAGNNFNYGHGGQYNHQFKCNSQLQAHAAHGCVNTVQNRAPNQIHHYGHMQRPVQHQAYRVQNYEQAYTQPAPVYTTGHYGTHAGYGHRPHMRGYYGAPKPVKPTPFYVQGYGGLNWQGGSDVEGVTTGFTTGNIGDGSTLVVADGTEYGWETDFDSGYVFGVEAGVRTDKNFRFGLEATRSKADVEAHENITLDGADIGALDGAALVGQATVLGATVDEFLADAQGDIQQTGLFVNGYYDFDTGSRFTPYVGAGIGMVEVDVNYSPSGSTIIAEKDTVLGYQGRVGASYNVNGPLDVFTEYTYRATGDVETDNQLFAGSQEFETKQSLVTVGARYNF